MLCEGAAQRRQHPLLVARCAITRGSKAIGLLRPLASRPTADKPVGRSEKLNVWPQSHSIVAAKNADCCSHGRCQAKWPAAGTVSSSDSGLPRGPLAAGLPASTAGRRLPRLTAGRISSDRLRGLLSALQNAGGGRSSGRSSRSARWAGPSEWCPRLQPGPSDCGRSE